VPDVAWMPFSAIPALEVLVELLVVTVVVEED
jgi:hypothetical protein